MKRSRVSGFSARAASAEAMARVGWKRRKGRSAIWMSSSVRSRAMPCSSVRIGFPGRRLDLAHVEEIVLEHAAAEQAEPGQGRAGGGAEVAAGELQRGAAASVFRL